MNIIRKISKLLINPMNLILALGVRGWFNWMNDTVYLRLLFRIGMGSRLNTENPQTFNEKLQWLKMNDRSPIYTKMVDKYAAKKYVAERIGEKYVIPTIGIWDNVEEIEVNNLPNQFVLKTTHDSGGVVICKDKETFNMPIAKEKLKKSLKQNYYYSGREWPYKDVPRRIIAEEYMVDESGTELKDYKFFCFDGEPQFVLVVSGRGGKVKRYIYDKEWKRIPVALHDETALSPGEIEKPANYDEMLFLARKLSKGMVHLRVDFYAINGKTYFGELTFYHMSGMERFYPKEYDYKFGEFIKLPK